MAGWIHSSQLEVIDFLREENRVLREQLGGRRLRFTEGRGARTIARGSGCSAAGAIAGTDAASGSPGMRQL